MVEKELIIFDRDGVINELCKPYVRSVLEFKLYPWTVHALQHLKVNNYKIAICSNQRGVALGFYSISDLNEIDTAIKNKTQIQDMQISYCIHNHDDNCDCRKPKPGMLLNTCKQAGVSVDKAIFVGDAITDYNAAEAISMDFCLVLTGYGHITSKSVPPKVQRYASILQFAQYITKHRND